MAASNRATRITKLVSSLKKHFKPQLPADRPLFESLIYGCLLENSPHEAADEAIEELEKSYFDWNEVRVSTRTELAEVLKPLNDPNEAADRLKRTLQSVFETFYAFDLELMKKQNLGQSVKQLSGCDGVTPFAVAYVTQNGLGGHAISLNSGMLLSMKVLDIISDAEHKKGTVPGLERAIAKNKAVEAGALLHLLGVEVGKSPYGKKARALLLELDPKCKERLPKRPAPPKPKPEPAPKPEPKAKAKAKSEAKKVEKKPTKKATPKKAAPKKKVVKKKVTKKAPVKKKVAKKTVKKKVVKKKVAKKAPAKKKVAKKKVAKKAPAKKKVAKKTAAKKKTTKRKPK